MHLSNFKALYVYLIDHLYSVVRTVHILYCAFYPCSLACVPIGGHIHGPPSLFVKN